MLENLRHKKLGIQRNLVSLYIISVITDYLTIESNRNILNIPTTIPEGTIITWDTNKNHYA